MMLLQSCSSSAAPAVGTPDRAQKSSSNYS